MTNAKTTRRALFTSTIALVLCFAMLMGTTFAWFTDSVSSTGNIIKSGTLDVTFEYKAKTTDAWADASTGTIFNYDKWEPGYTEVRYVKVGNAGTLALKYMLSIAADGEVSELADVIDVYFIDDEVAVTRDLSAYTSIGTLTDVLNGIKADPTSAEGNLEAGASEIFTVVLKMQEDAGNEYQELSIGSSFAVQVLATQYTEESDSFDNQYDKDAEYPKAATYVSTAAGLRDAMKVDGAEIVLTEDIVVSSNDSTGWGQHMFLANGKSSTVDLNGHNITVAEDATHIGSLFTVANGGSITINGDGNVEIKNGKAFVCWTMNSTSSITVNGGNYFGNGHDGNNALMYVQEGKIDVYGGKFTYPTAGADNWGFNVHNDVGDNLVIVIHEGVLLQHERFQYGDDSRIQLAEGCTLAAVEIDGETWYQVTKTNP